MRVYLVIMDESAEAKVAMTYASRLALQADGTVHMLALVPPQQFSAFGGVQATMEEEARSRAEVMVTSAAGRYFSESGRMPVISVEQGDPEKVVREYLAEHPEVSALVLGAAEDGPGPLVTHFSAHSGTLPCPLYIVPGDWKHETVGEMF
ncbi:universal stress protein [Pseudoblastomonas halimionae]|uniref:Universal stress protein n=1 Tax=Alteriqipengyuania halimionae TaxID=1926630 RepID=A0A6I4U5F0_9SPHN|nr:universal stress protein [Alteriqipengyuania halimionae]MXP09477.1 universal stress protein [Alteriqipengyuania halimionae]